MTRLASVVAFFVSPTLAPGARASRHVRSEQSTHSAAVLPLFDASGTSSSKHHNERGVLNRASLRIDRIRVVRIGFRPREFRCPPYPAPITIMRSLLMMLEPVRVIAGATVRAERMMLAHALLRWFAPDPVDVVAATQIPTLVLTFDAGGGHRRSVRASAC
jgi:hypothetical protein